MTFTANRVRGVGLALLLLAASRIAGHAQTTLLPKGTNVSSLVVIRQSDLGNNAQQILIATLQGVVARKSSQQIYVDGGSGYTVWINHLSQFYGITNSTALNYWLLVLQFAPLANGYVLYDATNADSINVANSLCGPLNAVAVDASIESQARLFGLSNKLADVRAYDEKWAWTNYPTLFSRSNVVEQQEWYPVNLRDYATMVNAFTFYDGNSAFRTTVMAGMDPDATCFGWGDASFGEDKFVSDSSSNGVHVVASNWALNLSTLSSVRDDTLTQHTYAQPTPETNVHYLCFMVTDGDNVEWDISDFYSYFNHPARGTFSMGWAFDPTLADISPSVLRWYYEHSSNSLSKDFFTVGASGVGYFYPSQYPASELALHALHLNNLMMRGDLNIVQILDFNSFSKTSLWEQYLAQPSIDALFYFEYAPYNGAHGQIAFASNGKPIIACREMLWGGLEEETNVIANVNGATRDISDPADYSMVAVHVWTKNMNNVQQVVTNLAPDVRIVTPDVFAKLIWTNVGCRLSYDFSSGLQGWVPNVGSKSQNRAQWTTNEGRGALLLDGSDFGVPDSTRNTFFNRQIILPPHATTLTFDTRALNDGKLRVRVKSSAGSFFTLLDWDTPGNTNWVTRSCSLAAFAGQTVTLYFEQNDGGQGNLETRYIDNVVISTSDSVPLYAPLSPRLFRPTANLASGVSLQWRPNGNNADQYGIERRAGADANWQSAGVVSGDATNYSDSFTAWGTNVSYRIRGLNAAGNGAWSNERDTSTPPKPALSISVQTNNVVLTWPGWATNYQLKTTTNLGASVWTSTTAAVSNDGVSYRTSIPASATTRFFRLQNLQ